MSLVEVLVALVIFAIGMLGAGGLILSSLRSNQFSTSASTAISLARDYGDIMQTIPARVESTAAGTTSAFTIDTDASMTAPSQTCQTNTCTPDQMIAASTWDWIQRVKAALPKGRAVICKDTDPKDSNGLYKWDCDESGSMMVIKFGWVAKTGAAGTGDDNLNATDSNNVVRPKLAVTLFGNQTDFVSAGGAVPQ